MATGAPGSNGVWLYGEDDSEATFSALLNKAGTTVNTQLGVDRGRITAVEGVNTTQNTRLTSLEGTRPGTAGKPNNWSSNGVVTSASAQVTVTYPVGRFSVTPLVTAQVVNHPNVCVTFVNNATSATSFDVGAFTIAGARVSAVVWWQAVQMTSGSAAG